MWIRRVPSLLVVRGVVAHLHARAQSLGLARAAGPAVAAETVKKEGDITTTENAVIRRLRLMPETSVPRALVLQKKSRNQVSEAASLVCSHRLLVQSRRMVSPVVRALLHQQAMVRLVPQVCFAVCLG